MKKGILLLALSVSLCGCSDKKAQEQQQIAQAQAQHCQRIVKLTLKEYTEQYMMHNGNTQKDRDEAKRDYLNCRALSLSGGANHTR